MKRPAAILITALAAISLLCSCGSPDTAPTRRTPRETTVAASGKNEKAAHEGGDTAPKSCETCAYGPGDHGESTEEIKQKYGGSAESTETSVTRTFIAYMNYDSDRPCLFDPSAEVYRDYCPDDGREIEPGKIYTATFDVFHLQSFRADFNFSTSYITEVSSFEPADASVLFAQGLGSGLKWKPRHVPKVGQGKISFAACGDEQNRFICVDTGSGYDVLLEDGSVLHFDDDRGTVTPPSEKTAEASEDCTHKEGSRKLSGYRVLCNDNITNEQIISEIENGTLSENKDIFLIGKDVYFYV